MKEQDESPQAVDVSEKITEVQISEFAAKLGEEIGNNYTVYIYRIVKDDLTGKTKHPFVLKLAGQEPDPLEIAERYRAGSYKIQFIWKDAKKRQQSKSYTLDIDADAFPPLVKNPAGIVQANSNLSEPMQVQLMMIQSISEVLKAAYASNGNGKRDTVDPMDQFSGMMETMETAYSRAMQLQQKVMERVITRNMESKFGLLPEDTISSGEGVAAAVEEPGIAKYAPLVRECVDGLRGLVSMFGDNVPKPIVQRVRDNGRFKTLLEDKRALIVIGQALRREFGDDRAARLMDAFGVKMVHRSSLDPKNSIMTPPIPPVASRSAVKIVPRSRGSAEKGGSGKAGPQSQQPDSKKEKSGGK